MRGHSIADYVRHVRFMPSGSSERPGYVTSVAQVAADAIWASTAEGVWEWTPESWHLLDNADDARPDQLHVLPDGALVGLDLLGSRFTLCVPPADLAAIRAVREGFGIENLVPDPDGEGIWGLETARAVSGAADGTRGHLRYFTPHGEMLMADGTVGGDRRFDVARLSWQHHDGTTDWPESEHGGLLLPSGIRWMHVRDGAWRAYDWPSTALVSHVRGLVPGGQSSTTAWLGIAGQTGPGPIVRFDMSDDRRSLSIASTKVTCKAEAIGIAADETGHRWLVCADEPGTWALHRIHAIVGEPDQQLAISGLPEPPRYLFTQPLRQYVLTDHGVAEVSRNGVAAFVRLLTDDERGRFVTLAPSLTRLTGPVPSLWTLFARRGLPPADSASAFELTVVANGARLNPASPPEALRAFSSSLVAGWVPQGAGPGYAPGAVVWNVNDGKTHVELYALRGNEPLHRVEALAIEDAIDVVRFRRADFKDSDAADGFGDLAIGSAQRIAMIDLRRRQAALLSLPISLTFERRNGTRDSYDLRTRALPSSVPHDTTRVEMTFAPDYDRWWRPAAAEVRGLENQPWSGLDASGVGAIGLAAGTSYTLEYRIPDRDRLGVLSSAAVPLRTLADPGIVPFWVYPLVLAAAIILVFAMSVRARRVAMVLLGRRWELVTGETDAVVHVTRRAGQVRISRRLPGDPREDFVEPPASGDLSGLRALLEPGTELRVIVDDDLFWQPWGQRIGTPWSEGERAVIGGQVVSMAAAAARAVRPARELSFTSLACERPGRGLLALNRAASESRAVSTQVKRWGGTVTQVDEATSAAFLRALATSDAVHVAAHASLAAIEFADRAFTIRDLTREVLASMRTRLLILSACQGAEGEARDSALAVALVRAGVNVIASTAYVDDAVCAAFFAELFRAFLPSRRAQEIRVSDAIRAASAACARRFERFGKSSWTPTIDSLVLYGDPSLHLIFRVPKSEAAQQVDRGGTGATRPTD